MRDLFLNSDGDIELLNGDLRTVSGADSIKQAIDLALSLFKNEWFLDGDLGIPYYENILVKSPNLNAIREIFRAKIAGVVGVVAVTRIDLTFDKTARQLTVTWQASSNVGLLDGVFTA